MNRQAAELRLRVASCREPRSEAQQRLHLRTYMRVLMQRASRGDCRRSCRPAVVPVPVVARPHHVADVSTARLRPGRHLPMSRHREGGRQRRQVRLSTKQAILSINYEVV